MVDNTLITIKALQDDNAELRRALVEAYARNKELEQINERLRSANIVLQNQHDNALKIMGCEL